MSCQHNNLIDDTTLEFPRTGFWIVHVIGAFFLVLLGMRLAVRRAPLPIIAYRLLKMLR
ncbi:hypothetical protein [Sporomusa acidovorans]|uniref:Uncharacterized protein n=1 Tax=Sporomusa acidovorans (strain ATCC 49682 / DSM 3132 / Mol) TaxID=1123286 RepID=A0ABZ3J548_SPOA4|nr:hypothetical protein [Sporomusa acidovorans]OZC15574.1 hypothetical protein SPACI_48780 [Sporomusa acidovorans DSM 3132]SDE18678.1 hypothetical protein SAMN04488499_1009107 [Sporomusa acidovorans]